ncbi:hypothetical protein AAC691_18275 [Nguyenibacter vanlangensis]|uniref:Uncharacterized protein n=1 Tax=Nguyenibacter vanlangensis TaxID=1216886 RepID=A0ABZ3D370_9PROT
MIGQPGCHDAVERFDHRYAELSGDPLRLRKALVDFRDRPITSRVIIAGIDNDRVARKRADDRFWQIGNTTERDGKNKDRGTRGYVRNVDGLGACAFGDIPKARRTSRICNPDNVSERDKPLGQALSNRASANNANLLHLGSLS